MSIHGFIDQNGQVQYYDFEDLDNKPLSRLIPAGGYAGQVLGKNSGDDYDVVWVDQSSGGGGSSVTEVFKATYGTTTSAQIEDAYQAGKIIICIYNNFIYQMVYRYSSTVHYFVAPYGEFHYQIYCNNNNWASSSVELAFASDIAGKANKVTEEEISSAGAVSESLYPNTIYHFTGALTSLEISSLRQPSVGDLAHYHFDFNSGSTAPTLTLPNTVIMPSDFAVEASKYYEIDIFNNYGAVLSW